MTKRMLIDATQPEETRVAVIENDRLDSYDFDSSIRKQIKGNIFLAKVTRVEPSLQACFVEYGGNRQGFLAFTEIHPDYYRIPVEDREALLAEEAEEWNDDEDDAAIDAAANPEASSEEAVSVEAENVQTDAVAAEVAAVEVVAEQVADDAKPAAQPLVVEKAESISVDVSVTETSEEALSENGDADAPAASYNLTEVERDNTVESVGGDEDDDARNTARRIGKLRRRYKIQEVIKRRQIMLVQATKEERGAKGAAMTTYISLPGRYCVLMPNSPRGGGVSRKITDPQARRKMKDLLSELDVPGGMSVILRTAGLTRTRLDIKRDLEYLLRLWDEIRRETMQSQAPALIYEEADIFKRTIRDLYTGETKEVIVSGEDGFKKVKTFMRQMVPLHAKRVLYYRDPLIPLFQRYGVEPQIANIFNPRVELKSGGYIIINPTEALVSIDVNSGRATRERHIDDTALKTNLEAAEEVARQLRLRDLGGLVVIDFIDMESSRHNAKVERKLREAMSGDRARIEIGRISAFGLLELSRQRLHPSLTETHFQPCEHCNGTGITRTTDSAAVVVMRAIEAEAARGRAISVTASVPAEVALYLLNHKREEISRIEDCFGCRIAIRIGKEMNPNDFDVTFEKGTPKAKRQVELLPVPVLEGSDDDFISAAEEEDDGEPLLSHVTEDLSDNDADEDGDKDKESGASSRGNGRRRNTRGRSRRRPRNDEQGEKSGEKQASGEAVIIPITTEGDASGNAEPIENPTDTAEARPRARRNNGDRRGNRHPYRRRRNNNGERGNGSDENSAASSAVADKGDKPSADVANDSAPSKESKKKGWWQKLIE